MARDDEHYEQAPEPYVASQPGKKHKGLASVLVLVIILMVVVAGLYLFYYLSSSTGQRYATEVWGKIQAPFVKLYNTVMQKTTSAGTAFYTAEKNDTMVDYGVKFVKFESVGSKKIPSGAMASFKYVVTVGQNVDNIPLTLDCKVNPQDVVDGDIKKIPEGIIQLSSENPAKANNLRCNFKTKEVQEDKTVTVKGSMSATIPVQRTSLKVYLLSQEAYEALNGKDFFKVNNKPDKLPIKSVYNGEPVEVGIAVSEDYKQPVIVGPDYTPPMVGIGLTNRWDGKVTKINSLSLFLPKDVSINNDLSPKSELCPFLYQTSTSSDTMVRYDADTSLIKGNFGSGETDNYRKFECVLSIQNSIVDGRKAGFATSYHVDIGYDYTFNEKSDVITVAKKETITTTPEPEVTP